MKISTKRLLVLFSLLLLGNAGVLNACNLSDLTFCGAPTSPLLNTSFPNDTLICLTVCNGYGVTGLSQGANSDTRSIGFGWYDSQPGFIIRAFAPLSITSGRGFDDCTMAGADVGPQGVPYNSQATILFIDPGYYGFAPCDDQPFGCITSTADCGALAQQCVTYTFQVNQIPDSVRVFGVEGAGNPLDGCYPDADMAYDFGVTSVEWGNIGGIKRNNTVAVTWSTYTEVNSDVFEIERVNADGVFEKIGTVKASGNSSVLKRYEFVDLSPAAGANRYRVIQIDNEGNSSVSNTVEVVFEIPVGLNWGAIGPNPANEEVSITYFYDRSATMLLTLSALDGKVVFQQEISAVQGTNVLLLGLQKINAGTYLLSLQGQETKVSRRLVKL